MYSLHSRHCLMIPRRFGILTINCSKKEFIKEIPRYVVNKMVTKPMVCRNLFTTNIMQQLNGKYPYCTNKSAPWLPPPAQGLYDPTREKDSCGVGFIVSIDGKRSHKILRDAETMSLRMEHRAAKASDNNSGDGAGLLTAIPHNLYTTILRKTKNIELPESGKYATGIIFMDSVNNSKSEQKFEELAMSLGLKVLVWRTVPIKGDSIGNIARSVEPLMRQPFIVSQEKVNYSNEDFEKYVYILRKQATHTISGPKVRFYICSLSPRIIVHKGQLTPEQLWLYYPELKDPLFDTYLAMTHTRFSTNTFPSWEKAHPFRMIAHNGEINTLMGNVNYIKTREGVMKSEELGDKLKTLFPIVEPNLSDSGTLDCVLEFLVRIGNRSLPEAVITLVPEAWQNEKSMTKEKRDFYQWAACIMEPWDGPALISFTDGRYIGAVLDRNGLRPSRFFITKDNILVMASEVGTYDVDPEQIVTKSRLKPGRMLLVDTFEKSFILSADLKMKIAKSRPHSRWLKEQFTMNDLKNEYVKAGNSLKVPYTASGFLDKRLSLYNYSQETINKILKPMIKKKTEPIGSMGTDIPLACLSAFAPLIYEYFKQLFAQVTNPPIDPFREKVVMSLECPLGPEDNLLNPGPKQAHRLWLKHPILSFADLEVLKKISYRGWSCHVLDTTYPVKEGPSGLLKNLQRLQEEAEAASMKHQLLVLSDRNAGPTRIPVGSLLAQGAIHHYLLEKRKRTKVSLIIETGEAREVHHFCLLFGYGADAVCPYLALELSASLREDRDIDSHFTDDIIFNNYSKAVEGGILTTMSKMGISTLQSYKGAQIFEAVGLAKDVIDKCFKGTASRIGGVTLEHIANESFQRHWRAYQPSPDSIVFKDYGYYTWAAGGEVHVNNPESIAALQDAAINKNTLAFEKFRKHSQESIDHCTIRGRLKLRRRPRSLLLSEIEPAIEIVKRFNTGAMSIGSLSLEAHDTITIAMNRTGGKSNSGEGGENPEQYMGTIRRSAVKQIASGRFGVTSSYLAHSDVLQIKMAQGAKPGEGGEIPGYKVTEEIARTRHSIPGVTLISPAPHHDVYSIEDLSELIYDLKSANPNAKISVKLASAVGVGVVATGVVKCKAEEIIISGHDGGTGASSFSSIKHTGLPWEMGVAETHQVLVMNDLRDRVSIHTEGQIRTGFDVVVAALLGADEVSFCTVPLIVLGCTMMKKCHLNTCPVGIATQDPMLRKKFTGQPEHVVNYLFMLANDVRNIMASLGVRKFQDLIGRTDFLLKQESGTEKACLLDLKPILQDALKLRPGVNIKAGSRRQEFPFDKRLDYKLLDEAKDVIEGKQSNVLVNMVINNQCRAFGATLCYHISMAYGEKGLPEGKSIDVFLKGSAGQSFCSFLTNGVNVTLEGEANDYVGKCLSGGTIVIYPPKSAKFESHKNVIAGNVCLYGATSGRAFIRGNVAERFCVRNSGATAVVEGVGDHGCEFMTGGVVVILGHTGHNFASGMSGGIAYVWDFDGKFKFNCNYETVELCALEMEDIILVKNLLTEFIDKTESVIARKILDEWESYFHQFIKVFPHDYKRSLSKTKSNVETEIPHLDLGEKNLNKNYGFVKYKRETELYRPVENRIKDWKEIYNYDLKKGTRVQAARCMNCGVPFCQSDYGCPLGNTISKWTYLVYKGQWQKALRQLLQTNNFPEITGRVCPAPCEDSCVLAINTPPVTIKNIERNIIDKAFENGWIKPKVPTFRTNHTIAVIGSGPAGLACAHQLNKVGHTVTVFERNDRIGGLLQYGISSMKLDKTIVQRRVDMLAAEGIIFKPKTTVGKDVSRKDLDTYKAVVLCTGSSRTQDLSLPGRQLKGIMFALDFLGNWQKKQLMGDTSNPDAKGKHVIIIGGDETSTECIGTALRQGAASIIVFDKIPEPVEKRTSDNPWPQKPKIFKVNFSHEEVKSRFGVDPRIFSITPTEFIDNGKGHISGVRTINVKWEKDLDGIWKLTQKKGTEQIFKADLVLIATGYIGPELLLPREFDLKLDSNSRINTVGYKTSTEKIFAAGDCRLGKTLVVTAIMEGREVARHVDMFLNNGETVLAGLGGIIQPKGAILCPTRKEKL